MNTRGRTGRYMPCGYGLVICKYTVQFDLAKKQPLFSLFSRLDCDIHCFRVAYTLLVGYPQ